MTNVLRVEKVSLSTALSSQDLLHNISFEVEKGDRIAIIGPSGAGKTTLLRLLNGLSEPTIGTLYFNDQNYHKIPIVQLRQQIVLVLQEPKLLGQTVAEALAYPLTLQQRPEPEIKQRVEYWREKFRIPEDWLDRNELQLSLGQRQWVAIARGLILEPQILLLDEPTSALDAGRASRLLEILNQLPQSHDTTIVMVNHQLEFAQQFSQRILYLQDGKLLKNTNAKNFNWEQLREDLNAAERQAAKEWSFQETP